MKTEKKLVHCGQFLGVDVYEGKMLQVWYDACSDVDEEFYIDFNNFHSFKMALENYTDEDEKFIDPVKRDKTGYFESEEYINDLAKYEEYIQKSFLDIDTRREFFIRITSNLMACDVECPGSMHASFTADEDNVMISLDGR